MGVDERDVGIYDYVGPELSGIGGVLKRKPVDFQVNEIDEHGSVVCLEADVDAARDALTASADECEHTRFTLRKERMDTLRAISELSDQLGVPSRNFGFAGLKDFRAVTTQEMTVRGVSSHDLSAVEHPHLRIGHARPSARKMWLGQLGGNRFRLVLRDARGGPIAVQGGAPVGATARLRQLLRASALRRLRLAE